MQETNNNNMAGIMDAASITNDEQRATALNNNPQFRKMQRKIKQVLRQMDYLRPELSPSEKLQRAASLVMASQPKPTTIPASHGYGRFKGGNGEKYNNVNE